MRFLLASALFSTASAATLPPEQLEFFESKIRPVLASECLECHGMEKQKGGLRLDYRDGWKAGGDTGPAIVPGEPAKSLLLKSIRHEDPDLLMPSKRPKLSDTNIADFEKWIALGAPDPRDQPTALAASVSWETLLPERAKWWSLQPVRTPALPIVRNTAWSEHPVDRFLLARMEAQGLTPGEEADSRTLYRRLCITLTGLLPEPSKLEAFATASAANREAALAQATDELLASPRFGEHWARHWLDLVRYAETHGSESDPVIPEAWRYRDYVIRAFNGDVPIDQLIREHIAGDLITPRWHPAVGINEALLGLAHWRLVEHGFQPIDTRDEQVKVVDSQIDVLTKAFQGLTVSCARCHDHKFDAISQRDYTALAGILESSRPAMLTLNDEKVLAEQRRPLVEIKSRIKAALATAWRAEAQKFPTLLNDPSQRDVAIKAALKASQEAERQVTEIEGTARARVISAQGVKTDARLPQPIARWSFTEDARDSIGKLHGDLQGGAVVRNGRLILDRRDAFVRTKPLGRGLREKTLEAWVALSSYDQAGGGVMTVETDNGAVFDSIVFAEKEPRRWMAGSDFYRRSRAANGPEEGPAPGNLVHLAVVYREDNRIAIYRNGERYGTEFTPAHPLVNFEASARLLFGRRHTGARDALLHGELDEARLYDRALSPEEVATSFQAGPSVAAVSDAQLLGALSEQDRRALEKARIQAREGKRKVEELAPEGKAPWTAALADARENPAHPLHAWVRATEPSIKAIASSLPASDVHTKNKDFPLRYHYGPGVMENAAGEFAILPQGDGVLGGLLPAGVSTGAVTRKHGGIAATARFQVTTDFISVHAAGANAQCRLIVDGYPLGVNPIYPRAQINQDEPRWLKLDTKYRKGSWAYLEFATAADLTRTEKEDSRSWFWVDGIVAHNDDGPTAPPSAHEALFNAATGDLAERYRQVTLEAIDAWQADRLSEPQRAWLDSLQRSGLLPARLASLPEIAPLVAEFRIAENAMPVPLRAPGVVEGDSYDSAFLPRGDHLHPGQPIPRGYLGVLGAGTFAPPQQQSGRLELAQAITAPTNPLTARVMVNRIWLHLFGQGLVPTPDSFGKMGVPPTHPELLDFLAARFVEDGWSTQKMIRYLVRTRTWQLASDPTPGSTERDPANQWLSHARVRRMEAESIRDSLLSLSGRLDFTMEGPSVGANAPRRSIYLAVRRTALHAFLTTFDAPKPFSTLGRRDSTNVPAQSLALMNDPFVINCAEKWADRHAALPAEARVRTMFSEALGRLPVEAEKEAALRYTEAGTPQAWRDFAQALLNVKEFLYVR